MHQASWDHVAGGAWLLRIHQVGFLEEADVALSLTAVTCPGVETQLSEHVTWRLLAGTLNEFGAQVLLSCSPGYALEGRRLLQCQANGTWSTGEEQPQCRGEPQGALAWSPAGWDSHLPLLPAAGM